MDRTRPRPVSRPVRRVLIANRGEIAVRVARTLREMGLRSVAVYSEADRDALHPRVCDEAVCIGPASAAHSYLNVEAVIDAAVRTGCDAVHPGYGFLSERPAFADACAARGIALVGPSAEAMRTMGDKTSARRAMQRAGVPVVPGSDAALDAAAALSWARRVGLPVMLKASAGGGGKGMRLVHEEAELTPALRAAASEAQSAFGDGSVYLEKALIRPRHVEIQIFADAHGEVVALGERDCSMQRRHQKVLEEAPSVAVDAALRARMGEVACQAARAVHYQGAGTVEFLLDEDHNFYFLEMNTRLQVEHPVTELVYGVDLVAAQLRVAMGEPLGWRAEDLTPRGHAIEARLYAEDPERDNLPAPGVVQEARWPAGPGVRVDAGVADGVEVTTDYDPMLAKVVAWAEDREGARRRLLRALRETHVKGITTNKLHLQALLASDAFVAGDYHTGTVAELPKGPTEPLPPAARDAALAAMALARYLRDTPRGPTFAAPQAQQLGWRLTPWRLRGA